MTNDHAIRFEDKKKERECRIDLSSVRIYKKIIVFCDLVYEITRVCFVWCCLFSHSSSGCSILCVDRILVVTVHLISTCCPFRISCTYHHQTYRIPRIYIHNRTRILSISPLVKLAARCLAIINIIISFFFYSIEKKKIWI
jgi:hypothetical protein